jgi:hypothetical protein
MKNQLAVLLVYLVRRGRAVVDQLEKVFAAFLVAAIAPSCVRQNRVLLDWSRWSRLLSNRSKEEKASGGPSLELAVDGNGST